MAAVLAVRVSDVRRKRRNAADAVARVGEWKAWGVLKRRGRG